MAFKHPMLRYRPVPVEDGEGGFNEILADPATIYGSTAIHENALVALIDMNEDVKVRDILAIGDGDSEGQYRVIGLQRVLGTRTRRATIERVQRPIVPLSEAGPSDPGANILVIGNEYLVIE